MPAKVAVAKENKSKLPVCPDCKCQLVAFMEPNKFQCACRRGIVLFFKSNNTWRRRTKARGYKTDSNLSFEPEMLPEIEAVSKLQVLQESKLLWKKIEATCLSQARDLRRVMKKNQANNGSMTMADIVKLVQAEIPWVKDEVFPDVGTSLCKMLELGWLVLDGVSLLNLGTPKFYAH